MASLAGPFGLEPIYTKSLAIIADARVGPKLDKSAVVERLLSISGEDFLDVHRKHKTAIHMKLRTRIVILTNEGIGLPEGSGALSGRFLALLLTKSFYGREDPTLRNKLSTELPGILNWAVTGYESLRRRGYFVQPESGRAVVEQMETLGAPIKAFIRDCCEVGVGFEVHSDALWDHWKDWSNREGRAGPGTREWFGRNLHSAVVGLTTKRKVDGVYYVGIKVSDPITGEEAPAPTPPMHRSTP
jgi:putative DNA primase/helicase